MTVMAAATGVLLLAGLACLRKPVLARPVVVSSLKGPDHRRRPVRRASTNRASADAVATLPEVIDLLMVACVAGLPAGPAVAAVAPRAPEPWRSSMLAALDAAAEGQLLVDALGPMSAVLGEAARPLVAVLRSALDDGDQLLEGLRRIAIDSRDLRRRRAEEQARRIPVRLLLPLVACSLPAFAVLTIVPILAGALQGIQLPD